MKELSLQQAQRAGKNAFISRKRKNYDYTNLKLLSLPHSEI